MSEEQGLFSIEDKKIDNEVIAKVIKRLKEIKTIALSNSFETADKNGFNSIDVVAKLQEELETKRFVTGTLIDDMLAGGLLPKKSLLLYGEPATGKSEIMYTMMAKAPDKIILIDAEHSFSARRFKQICDLRNIDFVQAAGKIVLFQPKDWVELMLLLYTLPTKETIGEISLVILDSLSKPFRGIEFAGRGELNVKQPLVREVPLYLAEYCDRNNCSFIMSVQVYQKPAATGAFMPEWTTYVPVGGAGLLHQTSYNLFLRHGEKGTQIARLTDADDVPLTETYFRIAAAGVVPLPDSEKSKLLMDKAAEYANKREKALEESKRGRKPKGDSTTDEAPDTTEAGQEIEDEAAVEAVLGAEPQA